MKPLEVDVDMDVDQPASPEVEPAPIETMYQMTARQRRLARKEVDRQQWLDAALYDASSNSFDVMEGTNDLDEDEDGGGEAMAEDTSGIRVEAEEEEQLSFLWQQFLRDVNDPFELTAQDMPNDEEIDAPMKEWGGPSTANFATQNSMRCEECPTHLKAGTAIPTPPGLEQEWRQRFGLDEPEHNTGTPFAPFKSELDWKVADWVVRDAPTKASCDRLLNIPGVRVLLTLIRSLTEV